jgi:hypothetical protein
MAMFREMFSLAAHPDFSNTLDGTPQNVVLRKGDTKLNIAINMYPHVSTCPVTKQTYKNKTSHTLDKIIDDGTDIAFFLL